jgi:hypothetical protein
MSSIPSCLDNIIGLSRSTCECFDEGKPYDANESKSGRYIDETEGLSLNMAEAAADCEQGSLWDMLSKARENALLYFKSDLMGRLLTLYKHRRVPYSGLMGGADFKNSLTQTTTYAGIQLCMQNIIGGVMSIKRIGLVFDQTADFDIYIYDNVTESAIASYTVHTNANALTWFDLPAQLSLDMNNYGNESPRYWIVYPTGAYQPKDNKASCGCGGAHYKYYWNLENPKYTTYEKYRWSEFLMLTGTVGDDITKDGRKAWATTQHLQGIILDINFKCKVQDLICVDEIDFTTNEIAASMAGAIQYRAASILVDNILASGNINRYTMTDRERLMGKKNSYMKEYLDRLEWIAQNININANDCLACDDFNDILKISILS